MATVSARTDVDLAARAEKGQGDCRNDVLPARPDLSRPRKGTDDLFESIPLGRRPYLGLCVAKSADQGGNLRSRFDIICDEDIEVVARSEHGIAVQPFHIWAFFPYALHGVAFKLL